MTGVVDRIEARPRARNIIASVAMKGCTSKYWIMTPEITPNTAPNTIISSMESQPLTPMFISITPATELKATTAPTDRSMPPEMITNVMPTARMIVGAKLTRRLDIVPAWNTRPYAISA